jgi:hypothetical protein
MKIKVSLSATRPPKPSAGAEAGARLRTTQEQQEMIMTLRETLRKIAKDSNRGDQVYPQETKEGKVWVYRHTVDADWTVELLFGFRNVAKMKYEELSPAPLLNAQVIGPNGGVSYTEEKTDTAYFRPVLDSIPKIHALHQSMPKWLNAVIHSIHRT